MAPRPAPSSRAHDATDGVRRHVVVDGSNIATEGREAPSLAQLDEAVQAFMREYGPEIVTVVVDATFPNRIARGERKVYEAAAAAGEIITPPAGAIGRGDAFILQIADRADATILSNDSFQEFHGQYDWLFDHGRLIGGKPVPHVGWVFMDRTPVRGPQSRRSVSAAKRAAATATPRPAKAAAKEAAARKVKVAKSAAPTKATSAAKAAAAEPPSQRAPGGKATARKAAPPEPPSQRAPAGKTAARKAAAREAPSQRAPAGKAAARKAAPPEAPSQRAPAGKPTAPEPPSPGAPAGKVAARTAPAAGPPAPANEALPFIEFVAAHPVGSRVEAVVEQFSSHGAYARIDDVHAYLPLKHLAVPAPRSPKQVLRLGERREFVVVAVDPSRRGVDLAMPGVDLASVEGGPAVGGPPPPAEPAEARGKASGSTAKSPARGGAAGADQAKSPARGGLAGAEQAKSPASGGRGAAGKAPEPSTRKAGGPKPTPKAGGTPTPRAVGRKRTSTPGAKNVVAKDAAKGAAKVAANKGAKKAAAHTAAKAAAKKAGPRRAL